MNRMASAEPLLQLADQLEDLRLHGDVEGGDRLVGDEHLGLEGERPGDADALALAAGEFMRIAVGRLDRKPDEVEQVAARAQSAALGHALRDRTLGDDAPDRAARVERGIRVLEHHLDAAALAAEGRACDRSAEGDLAEPGSRPGRVRPGAARSAPTVDLPEPDSPTRPSVSPRRIAKLDIRRRPGPRGRRPNRPRPAIASSTGPRPASETARRLE